MSIDDSAGLKPEKKGAASLCKAFFSSRWRGQAPLNTLFWRDMVGYGTSLNILASLSAFLLLAAGFPWISGLLIFLVLLPWNLFLFLSVWRMADRMQDRTGLFPKIGASVWLAFMLFAV